METSKEWAARIRALQAAKTPEERAADVIWMEQWLASLPHLPPPPTQPGEVQAVFYRKSPTRITKEE